jgi:hypothetical protein
VEATPVETPSRTVGETRYPSETAGTTVEKSTWEE